MPAERETLEVDVLIVGGGPAGLSAAWHLVQSVKQHNEKVARHELPGPALDAPSIALVEKAEDWGNHTVSGAVMDPRGISELMPDWRERGLPVGGIVEEDEVLFLTAGHRVKLPILPPFMHNEGYPIRSLGKAVKWLAGEGEAAGGVDMFAGFSASEVLYDGERVVGVRTGDRGVNAKGERKSNYEPGVDIRAKVTLFTEGTRGHLVKSLTEKLHLNREHHPQVYATGIKEVWQVNPAKFRKGYVAHTMGYPLDNRTYGGGFLYHCYDNLVSLGFVVGLDYEDPNQDPHADFNAFKRHPYVANMLEGGKVVQYGAKTIPEGGWYAIPQTAVDGALIAGDSAGFLNAQRLKGVHLAMKTGMLAADTMLEALVRNDTSQGVLAGFWNRVENSWVKEELYPARNFRQGFQGGVMLGMLRTGLQLALGGRDWADHLKGHEDHTATRLWDGACRRGRPAQTRRR